MTERTSARVAKIAAKVLAMKTDAAMNSFVQVVYARNGDVKIVDPKVSWSDIRALAASCLTQAPDRAIKPQPQPKIGTNRPHKGIEPETGLSDYIPKKRRRQ